MLSEKLAGFADSASRAVAAVRVVAGDPRVRRAARSATAAGAGVVRAAASAGGRAVPAARDLVAATGPVVAATARDVASAARSAARRAVPAAREAAVSAKDVVSGAVRTASEQARACSGAGGRRDPRPRERVNARTGQRVTTQAYVLREDGTRDYDAVYPQGARDDFGPIGNKVVGAMLLAAGVPMLVLPGPGMAAIAAGMYYLTKPSPGLGRRPGPGGAAH